MKYRQLGRSGVRVSALCLGTMNFGPKVDEKNSIKIIQEALNSGINFIDTADVYGPQGISEKIVGKAIAQGGWRNKIVLATKAVAAMGDGPNDYGASRYHLIRACEESLRRLKTDRIDLYYLHLVDISTPMDEILSTLQILIKQGKILYIGTSKWPVPLIMEALAFSKHYGLPRIIVEQPPYNLLDRSIENELIWTCIHYGIGIVSFSPLAGGILSGKYRKEQKPPEGSRYEKAGTEDKRLTPKALDVVEKLLPIAQAKDITLSELAHAWLLQRPGITAPIIGPKSIEHLRSAIKACEVKLSKEELSKIDEIIPPGTAVSNYYDVNVYAHMRRALNTGDPMSY